MSTVQDKEAAIFWWQNGITGAGPFDFPPGPVEQENQVFVFPEKCHLREFHHDIFQVGFTGNIRIRLIIDSSIVVDQLVIPGSGFTQTIPINFPAGFIVQRRSEMFMRLTTVGGTASTRLNANLWGTWLGRE